jgi:hypothetical protein
MMTTHTAAATYVQISREELEGWLDTIGYRGKWKRDPKYAGVYLIELAPTVGVKLSSTIGSKDDAMGVGQASMQLALVSLMTGKVLNKKAQGQSHFKRTTGWAKTWAGGIDTMKKAYLASADFYDVISTIADRDKYQRDLLEKISLIPGWNSDAELAGYYRKIEKGGILMPRELGVIEEAAKRPAKTVDPQRPTPVNAPNVPTDNLQEQRVAALRELWVRARRAGDDWTMNFAEDIAKRWVGEGRRLSGPQIRIITEKLDKYRVGTPSDRASDLFR